MENNNKTIISACQTCRFPIYQGEPIYSFSKAQSSGSIGGVYGRKEINLFGINLGTHGSHYRGNQEIENWVQCAWCYDQWQKELRDKWIFRFKWWPLGFLFMIIIVFLFTYFFPGNENWTVWYQFTLFTLMNLKFSFSAILVFIASLLLVLILSSFFEPNADRYKMRKRKRK